MIQYIITLTPVIKTIYKDKDIFGIVNTFDILNYFKVVSLLYINGVL